MESETGKQHARRWMYKATSRISRKSKRDRPVDLRAQIQSRALSKEIIDGVSIVVTPPLAIAHPRPPRPKRQYALFAARHNQHRAAQDAQELRATA